VGSIDMRRSAGTITIREADTIWREDGGWFDARWQFSLDRDRDPEQMGRAGRLGRLLRDEMAPLTERDLANLPRFRMAVRQDERPRTRRLKAEARGMAR
jgi:hypothetical protein